MGCIPIIYSTTIFSLITQRFIASAQYHSQVYHPTKLVSLLLKFKNKLTHAAWRIGRKRHKEIDSEIKLMQPK